MVKDSTVITVAVAELDEYGNLNVTDTSGNMTRINKKHEKLHPLFEQGRAIKLIWDSYKGTDYVDDAELFDGKPPVEQQTEPITAGVEKSQLLQKAELGPREKGQAQGRCWTDIRSLIESGNLSKVFGKTTANKIWCDYIAHILGTLEIEHDRELILKELKSKEE